MSAALTNGLQHAGFKKAGSDDNKRLVFKQSTCRRSPAHALQIEKSLHQASKLCVCVYILSFNSVDAESEMKMSAQAVRRHVDQEQYKQNFEFCIQSRFRMQSYSSSATQIGYRACGKEKVINIKWIPQQPFTRQRRQQFERTKKKKKRRKRVSVMLLYCRGMCAHAHTHARTRTHMHASVVSAPTLSGLLVTAEWREEPSFQ